MWLFEDSKDWTMDQHKLLLELAYAITQAFPDIQQKDKDILYLDDLISLRKMYPTPKKSPYDFNVYSNKVIREYLNRERIVDFHCDVCGCRITGYDLGLYKCLYCQELYSCE